jgi:hypothetical protein
MHESGGVRKFRGKYAIVDASWAVLEIMIDRTNYKGLITYAELLNALYLTELNKRQFKNSTKFFQHQPSYMAVNAGP